MKNVGRLFQIQYLFIYTCISDSSTWSNKALSSLVAVALSWTFITKTCMCNESYAKHKIMLKCFFLFMLMYFFSCFEDNSGYLAMLSKLLSKPELHRNHQVSFLPLLTGWGCGEGYLALQ